MSLKDIIESDNTNVFAVEDNTPLSVQAVYTPPGGVAQTAVTLLFYNAPTHGDEYQMESVEWEEIMALGNSSDVSSWVLRGTVTINSIDYEIINSPYSTNNFWSVIPLRRPLNNQTRI